MHRRIAYIAMALLCMTALFLSACTGNSSNQPVNVRVWTYYNGDQLSAFQQLVSEYNSTVGIEKGIVVEGFNLGSVDDLKDAVMDSVNGKVGAEPVPNAFMAYADTAYAIDQMGLLADLAPYLSQEEREMYVDGYLEEGTLGGAGAIKIFPVAKSVELFVLNKTDFEPFAQETGISIDDLATFEGVTEVAQKYYEWTDAQTPEPGDGRAFCGIDSLANYHFIGAKQLGTSLVSVEDGTVVLDFNKETARKLWDNFYVPFIKGYFAASGRYRSDDIKTGSIISLIGSSSGATYFPAQVVNASGEEHAIEMEVLPCPQFADGQPFAVQQGAGMVVVNTSEAEVEATVHFLEWFTEPEQNVKFSVSSGYLPVMKSANSMDVMLAKDSEIDARMQQIISVGITTVKDNELYTPPAFEHGSEFRNVLEYSMKNLAASDAQVVKELIDSGVNPETAKAPYLTDAHFEEWYALTSEQLNNLVG